MASPATSLSRVPLAIPATRFRKARKTFLRAKADVDGLDEDDDQDERDQAHRTLVETRAKLQRLQRRCEEARSRMGSDGLALHCAGGKRATVGSWPGSTSRATAACAASAVRALATVTRKERGVAGARRAGRVRKRALLCVCPPPSTPFLMLTF